MRMRLNSCFRSTSLSVRRSLPFDTGIEGKKARRSSVKEQITELWSATFIHANNFAIDNSLAREWERQLCAQIRISVEGVTVTGDQLSATMFVNGAGAKAIVL